MKNFKIGHWLVNPTDSTITHKQTIKLDFKIMKLLCFLVENEQQVVSRDQIMEAVWGNQVVADDVLNVAISNLRKSLGDDTKAPRFIKTIPRRGYQVIAEVVTKKKKSSLLIPAKLIALLIILIALYSIIWQSPDGNHKPKKLAVLPFEYIGANPDDEYIVDGFTEAIINQLAREQELSVTSRTSVMQFKNKQSNINHIAEQLNVQWILEGSVQMENSQIVISAQLIDAHTDNHIWSERYRSDRHDLLSLQWELSKQIAANFLNPISKTEQLISPQAYELYLKARYYHHQFNLEQAEALYQEAFLHDEKFALAYAGLAQINFLRAFDAGTKTPDYLKKGSEFAIKAFELNPNDALTNLNRALAYYLWENEYNLAGNLFRKAYMLNNQDTMILEWFINYLLTTKQFEYGQTIIKHMKKVSPLAYNKTANYLNLYYAQNYQEALNEIKNISPYINNPAFYPNATTWIYLAQQDLTMLHESAPGFLANYGANDAQIKTFQNILSQQGLPKALDSILKNDSVKLTLFERAELLAWQGNHTEALKILSDVVKNKEFRAYKIHIEPAFMEMRDNQQFQQLLETLNLTQFL